MRETSGIAPGLLSLPSGGGGIGALGDRFQPDLVRGSGSYAIPINCPKGPNELRPSLSLTYSTGSGNGPFGLGWRLNVMRIERKSDRGIPEYADGDTFVIGDAEVLVHVGGLRYRPKTDNKFWLIERTGDSWRILTGDGKSMFFGQTEASRESNGSRVFAWYLDEERDAAGNIISFTYKRDGSRLYLDEVRYSIFSLHFAYEPRPDILRNGRSGFERLTTLRLKSIELHCDRLEKTLMRTYAFAYKQALNGASLLTGVSLFASDGGKTSHFPELTFEYSLLDFTNWKVHDIKSQIKPPGLDDKRLQLVDMTGDGLPDILESSGSFMFLWRNNGAGWLEGPIKIEGVPSIVSLERDNVAFADLDGNGRVDLFAVDQPLQLMFESNGKGGFMPEPTIFRDVPSLRLNAEDTRLMDTDGDGVTDLISTGRDNFLLFRHIKGKGWQEPQPVQRISDLEKFPDITFGDRGVRLADMSGDGLQDILLVQSGNVVYWPYYGNGVWGQRVEMQNSPVFPAGYRDDRIHVADLDGDGCSDIVYIDSDRMLIWINRLGTGFAAPIEIPIVPAGSGHVIAADFFGDGRPGFIWTASSVVEDSAGYRFLRFDAEKHPYLMTTIKSGMGGISEIEYSDSTFMRLEDDNKGSDWTGELPFVVPVVRTIREKDLVNSRITELSMLYHNGVYDGPEREFRGFSRVTVDLNGDESVPASRQEVVFFQGDPELSDLVERERQRAMAGSLQAIKIFEHSGSKFELRHESIQTWDVRSEEFSVYFPFVSQIETHEYSPRESPQRIERTKLLDYDVHGNPGKRIRESFADGEPPEKWIKTEERYTYTNNENAWIVKQPVSLELRDGDGLPFAVKITYYDGSEFIGLPEGNVEKGLPTRVQELKFLESRLPADYVGKRDFSSHGFEFKNSGDTRGYYATTLAVKRDEKGNIIEQKDPLGHSLSIIFDTNGVYPIKTIDARMKETTFVFDPKSGEPSLTTFSDGRSIRSEFDPLGRLLASFETDDEGHEQLVKCWLTDVASMPMSVTSIVPRTAGRKLSEFSFDTDLEALSDISVSRIYYDGFGKQALQVTSAGERFVASGQILTNPRGLVKTKFASTFVSGLGFMRPSGAPSVVYRYDHQGDICETFGPGPVHFSVVKDTFTIHHYEGENAGLFDTAIPPGSPARIEYFDSRGRLIRIEETKSDGAIISTSYKLSIDGRIQTMSDKDGNEVASYVIPGPTEPIRISHCDAGIRTYYRDAAGRLVERKNEDGSALYYSYDALSRLTRIEYSSSDVERQLVREIIYDKNTEDPSFGKFLDGRIALVQETGNKIKYSYNRAGKVVREEITAGGIKLLTEREYDLQGHPIAITYPDRRRLEYTIDATGTVRAIPGIVTSISYTEDGIIEAYSLANGINISMPRDPVSKRLIEVSARKGTDTLRRVAYAYDTVGNITGMRDELPGDIEQQAFTYDGLHRLSSFTARRDDGSLLRQGTYSYDSSGNIQRIEEIQVLNLNYSDAVHPGRLTGITKGSDTGNVNYDAKGNIEAFGDLASIEFDPLDRVNHVLKVDGTEINIAYDPQSRRILKEVIKTGTTSKIYYAEGLYEKHDNFSIRHIWLGNLLIASEKTLPNGTTEPVYHLSDYHGTLLLSMDRGGKVIHNQRYSPFGLATDIKSVPNRYLGREQDIETGLIHLGARYYAPALGRFISPDWYILENPKKAVRLPQSFNPYSYALNNPLVFKDPSGLWFGIDDLIVAAVGFTVGFVSGLIYGLANGQGWGSLLTALETGLTTGAGAWLGWNMGMLVGGPVFGVIGAVMGGMNGLVSGIHGIYDWSSASGWFAFISDSTWNLLGTSLGNVVHIVNLFYSDANYREDLSHRQNRHIYEGGFALKKEFAFTQGNVISNAGQGTHSVNTSFISNHEELHIWQQRFFGPIFQATYIVWGIGGFIVGTIAWAFNSDHEWGSLVTTAAYYDNPFEYWAYKNDNYWPPGGSDFDSMIAW